MQEELFSFKNLGMNLFPCQGQASKSLKDPGPLNKTGCGAHFDVTASTEQGPRRHSWEGSLPT